ncbi:uncharacterized protein [Palaemon carinicauda]|uniref:uncharacterized protein n=1 Tax=Palaemon carinicauda TaxID=392227 RepID=UPI0035B64DC0
MQRASAQRRPRAHLYQRCRAPQFLLHRARFQRYLSRRTGAHRFLRTHRKNAAPVHPVPVSPRAVQQVPELAHRRPQVPVDSSRPIGGKRDVRSSPVPVTSRAVQKVPESAHRRPQVPADSSRPTGEDRVARSRVIPSSTLTRSPSRAVKEVRDAHSRAVIVPALARSPTRSRGAPTQHVAPEMAKLAHRRSQPPTASSGIARVCCRQYPRDAHRPQPVPATRPVPVFKATVGVPHAVRNPRPLKQPVPDTRYARQQSPAQLTTSQANRAIPPDRRPQVSRDSAIVLSPSRRVLPDTGTGAPVISRPSGSHQVAARPRVRAVPDRRTPTPSPTRSHGLIPARSPRHDRAIDASARHRFAPAPAHAGVRARSSSVARPRGCARDLVRARDLPASRYSNARDPVPGPVHEPQRDRRQADSYLSRSPLRKRRPARSPEGGRSLERSRDSSFSAQKANPRLLTPPRDPSVPFPPEGVSASAAVSQ